MQLKMGTIISAVISNSWVVVVTILIMSCCCLNGIDSAAAKPNNCSVAAAQATALFVFGDSLVDNGNNNFLNSIAKSNYYPYGVDSKGGASGKFSNGDIFVDYLGAWLGIPAPPPFADPKTSGSKILGGVNYASAAAGILDETGQHYGQRYSLSQQVINFETTLSQLRGMMSPADLNNKFLSKSIALLVFGSNDYINNYLLPTIYSSSYNYKPPEYANLLLNHYARQLVTLYSLGLRKFFIAGVGPLGCIPSQLSTGQSPPGRCVDYVNQILGPFNQGLLSLVDIMNNGTHPGSMFVYGNTYTAIGDILNNPPKYGFKVRDSACCGIGRNQGQITCLPWVTPCPNRNDYVFWDAFHPTQAVDAIVAYRAYSGPPSDSHPINVHQLALINF